MPLRGASAASMLERIGATLAARTPVVADRDPPYSEAAVAIVLRANSAGDDLELLLMLRATRDGDPWSGHVSLPGGRLHMTDASLEETALRETIEELGVDIHAHGRVLGMIDEFRPRVPGLPSIIVRPYVCTVRDEGPLVPNEEVASAHWVSLTRLYDSRTATTVEARGMRLRVDAFLIDGLTVWGMTERILTNFAEVIGG